MGLCFASAWLLCRPVAHAGSCCFAASAFGVGRLALWEDWAIGAGTDTTYVWGEFNANGTLNSYSNYREIEWRLTPWFLTRLHSRLEVYGKLPLVLNIKSNDTRTERGFAIGDAGIGLWITAFLAPPHLTAAPDVRIHVGATLPSGLFADRSRSALLADVTGRGSFVVNAALNLEWVIRVWFVRLESGVSVPLPFQRADLGDWQRFGPALSVQLSAGRQLTPSWTLSGMTGVAYETARTEGGQRVDNSESRVMTAGIFMAYLFAQDHFTFQAGINATLPIAGLSDNQAMRVGLTLGLRHSR